MMLKSDLEASMMFRSKNFFLSVETEEEYNYNLDALFIVGLSFYGATTLTITSFSIITHSIATLSTTIQNRDTQHKSKKHHTQHKGTRYCYTECLLS